MTTIDKIKELSKRHKGKRTDTTIRCSKETRDRLLEAIKNNPNLFDGLSQKDLVDTILNESLDELEEFLKAV